MDHNAATQVLPLWVSQTLARLDLFHPDSYGRALVDVLASKTNENGSVIVSCGGKGVYKMAERIQRGREKRRGEDAKKGRSLYLPQDFPEQRHCEAFPGTEFNRYVAA